MRSSEWSSNKATFRVEKNTLIKHYDGLGSAESDFWILRQIAQDFFESDFDGWRYRALSVAGVEPANNKLEMEYIPSRDLRDVFRERKDPFLFVHFGRWIGLLHNASRDAENQVTTFNDYNCSNLLIANSLREVVAVDPGGYESLRSHSSISIVIAVFSIFRCGLAVSPFKVRSCITNFFLGYSQGGGRHPKSFAPGLSNLKGRLISMSSRPLIRSPRLLRKFSAYLEVKLIYILIKRAVINNG